MAVLCCSTGFRQKRSDADTLSSCTRMKDNKSVYCSADRLPGAVNGILADMKFSMSWALLNSMTPLYSPRILPEPHNAGATPPSPLAPWQTAQLLE